MARQEYIRKLRLPPEIPEWWKLLTPEQAILYINEQTDELVYLMAVARYIEWKNINSPFDNDGVDTERRKIGYYARAQEIQEVQDALFRAIRPAEAEQTASQFGSVDERWRQTQRLVYTISDILGEPKREDFRVPLLLDKDRGISAMLAGDWPGKPKRLIVHGRTKSDLSIWAKMFRQFVNRDEVFDVVGIQVLVEDDIHAREIQQKILDSSKSRPDYFTLRSPHTFARQEERSAHGLTLTNDPIRDYLDKPVDKYRAIRMNFVDTPTRQIFEVQITPTNVYAPPQTYMTQMVHKAHFQTSA